MLKVVGCALLVVLGWFAADWYREHRADLPSVRVQVDPGKALSFHARRLGAWATSSASKAVEDAKTARSGQFFYGPLDTNAGDGYVTPGIQYYPPPL